MVFIDITANKPLTRILINYKLLTWSDIYSSFIFKKSEPFHPHEFVFLLIHNIDATHVVHLEKSKKKKNFHNINKVSYNSVNFVRGTGK